MFSRTRRFCRDTTWNKPTDDRRTDTDRDKETNEMTLKVADILISIFCEIIQNGACLSGELSDTRMSSSFLLLSLFLSTRDLGS